MFPALVSILLQGRPWYPHYIEARLQTHQTEDKLHLFGTISAPDLLHACKTRRDFERHIKARDMALGLPMSPSGEGIVGPYDDDDRETVFEFIEWIRQITLHRHAKLLMPRNPVEEYIQPYGIELDEREGYDRIYLDISGLEVDAATRETLDACSWLLQSNQWEEPELQICRARILCKWDMLKPLVQTVGHASEIPMRNHSRVPLQYERQKPILLTVNFPQYVAAEEFQAVMLDLAHYLTTIPDQLRLIDPTALFLQVAAETRGARFPLERPYGCCAYFTMTGQDGATRGDRSFELWLGMPPAENHPEGDDWEVTQRFTFRDDGGST
jgi:hypothetical protein